MKNAVDVNQNTGQVPYEGKGYERKGGAGAKGDAGKGWQTGTATMEKIMTDEAEEYKEVKDSESLEEQMRSSIFSWCKIEKDGTGIKVTGYLLKKYAALLPK